MAFYLGVKCLECVFVFSFSDATTTRPLPATTQTVQPNATTNTRIGIWLSATVSITYLQHGGEFTLNGVLLSIGLVPFAFKPHYKSRFGICLSRVQGGLINMCFELFDKNSSKVAQQPVLLLLKDMFWESWKVTIASLVISKASEQWYKFWEAMLKATCKLYIH